MATPRYEALNTTLVYSTESGAMVAENLHAAAYAALSIRGFDVGLQWDIADVKGCDTAWMLAYAAVGSGPSFKFGAAARRLCRGIMPRYATPHNDTTILAMRSLAGKE